MNLPKSHPIRILMAACVVAVLTAVSALAYLSAATGTVPNSFTPETDPSPTVQETFADGIKTDVKVNVGNLDYAVYVRAVIVANWEKDETTGTYYGLAPVLGTDYTLELNTDNWFEENGFYYYKTMIHSGTTENLIHSCKLVGTANQPAGYHLNVQIIAQTIQALGKTDVGDQFAVEAAWGISVNNDGTLNDST